MAKKQFYVSETFPDHTYTAAVVRGDIEALLREWGYQPVVLQDEKLGLSRRLRSYRRVLMTALSKDQGDSVFFHFPVFSRAKRLLLQLLRSKGVECIACVHDFEGLRCGNNQLLQKELVLLSRFTKAIVLNQQMQNYLAQHCPRLPTAKLFIWDYPLKEWPQQSRQLKPEIAFTGNPGKAGFIEHLGKIQGVHFHLYGAKSLKDYPDNCSHEGEVDSKRLPFVCKGSFGLVWDGPSLESCTGLNGLYLQINSPHKISLYIMAGLPILVWGKAATADWIAENGIGIRIENLYSLPTVIESVTTEEYKDMQAKIALLQPLVATGKFLQNALAALNDLPR